MFKMKWPFFKKKIAHILPRRNMSERVIELLDPATISQLTTEFLLSQPYQRANAASINEYIVRACIQDSRLLGRGDAMSDVSRHLSETRRNMRAAGVLSYDSAFKLWTLLPDRPEDHTHAEIQQGAWTMLKSENDIGPLMHALFKKNPEGFELFCINFLQDHCGCHDVQQTDKHKYSKNYKGDGGADAYGVLGGIRFAMEAKCHHPSSYIGEAKTARFYQSMKREKITRGFFITTTPFASNARQFWDSVKDEVTLEMIDGKKLLNYMCDNGGYGAKRENGKVWVDMGFIVEKGK